MGTVRIYSLVACLLASVFMIASKDPLLKRQGIILAIISISAAVVWYAISSMQKKKKQPPIKRQMPPPLPRVTSEPTSKTTYLPLNQTQPYFLFETCTSEDGKEENSYYASFGQKYYTNKREAEFWVEALRHIYDFAKRADYAMVHEFIGNILADKDNEKYAYELYILIDHAIIDLYPCREYQQCTDVLIDLGFRGISILDQYLRCVEELGGNPVWRFPTKLVILLERQERYEEAIELCDFLASRNVIDSGYGTFEIRRDKIVSKYEKKIGR